MYQRTYWVNHVVERPNTYNSVTNADGTRTDTEAFGQVIQQGTPISAANLNKLEEEVQHYAVAFEMFMTITQAQQRSIEKRVTTAEAQLAALAE